MCKNYNSDNDGEYYDVTSSESNYGAEMESDSDRLGKLFLFNWIGLINFYVRLYNWSDTADDIYRYECKVCDNSFESKKLLRKHLELHLQGGMKEFNGRKRWVVFLFSLITLVFCLSHTIRFISYNKALHTRFANQCNVRGCSV